MRKLAPLAFHWHSVPVPLGTATSQFAHALAGRGAMATQSTAAVHAVLLIMPSIMGEIEIGQIGKSKLGVAGYGRMNL